MVISGFLLRNLMYVTRRGFGVGFRVYYRPILWKLNLSSLTATLVFPVYPHYGNFIEAPKHQPSTLPQVSYHFGVEVGHDFWLLGFRGRVGDAP